MVDILGKAVEVAITAAVSGALGWFISSLRVDSKITRATAGLRQELATDSAKSLAEAARKVGEIEKRLTEREAHALGHESVHRSLDTHLMGMFHELEGKIRDVGEEMRSSADDFAKEAAVGAALVEVHKLCRELLESVSMLQGTVDTMIRLDRRGR